MIEGKWQERGVGQLKLNKGNILYPHLPSRNGLILSTAKDGKCRLLMRDQGGKHLRLNTALFAEMKVDKTGDKSVQFVAIGTGGGDTPNVPGTAAKLFTTFAVKVARKEEAEEIYDGIEKQKKEITATSTSTSTTSSPAKAPARATTEAEAST